MIGIEGSIQTRQYKDKSTGKSRTAFEVIANNVQFVESKKQENQRPSVMVDAEEDFTEVPDGDLPF